MTIAHTVSATFRFTALYHMTHIDNISSIMTNGLLAHGNGYQRVDISDNEVNRRRGRLEPIYQKPIHTYVPFYFNPKNAMLYRRKEIQDDIVILVFDKELIASNGAIFTDGNASSDGTWFSNDLSRLNSLPDWKILTAYRWNGFYDGRRKRMAEVLVPNFVGIDRLKRIVCNSYETSRRLREICPRGVTIEVKHRYYF